ncbi:MAG: STAS domain-containing protein [Clostridia bacterium]|nr:STAS domain-containing protein [Clostridia bacterium]
MTFKKMQKGNTVTCVIEGRIDTQSSPDLQVEFEKVLNEEIKKFVLDFEKVNYLSSAGLRVILWLQKKVSAMDEGYIEVINANDEVFEVFDMTGFTDFLPVNAN